MLINKIKFLEVQKDENGKVIKNNSAVKTNFIDNEIFESALEDTNNIKKGIAQKNEKNPFFKKLAGDFFQSLYKPNPEVNAKENVYNSLNMAHDLFMDSVSTDEKFEILRANTAGDMFSSTLALGTFMDSAYEKYEEWIKKSEDNKEIMDEINDMIKKQDNLDSLIEESMYEPDNQDLKNEIEDLKNEIDELDENLKDILNGPGSESTTRDDDKENPDSHTPKEGRGAGKIETLTRNMQDIIDQVNREVEDSKKLLNNFGIGLEESNEQRRLSFDEKFKLTKALRHSSKLKSISNQLGRVKSTVGKVGKKPSKYGQSLCDIGLGDNIKRSLSTEKVKLLDKDLELDFYKKVLDKGLLEYKTQGVEDNKGPIIVCLDMSGSMYGKREEWAKAVTIASLQLAFEQRRSFRCICFDNSVTGIYDFPKGEYDIDKMIKLAEFFSAGGTEYQDALQKSLESIEESNYKKADILFITDGAPFNNLSSEFKTKFNSVKNSKGFKVQSILIQGTNTKYLKEFSDEIITLKDLENNGELVNIFKNMKED